MRKSCHFVIAILMLSSTASFTAYAQERLSDELFGDELEETQSGGAERADPFEDEPAASSATDMTWDEAPELETTAPPRQWTRAELMQRVSAGVSAGCGAFAVSLVGSGAAFAHAGLWSLAPNRMEGLVGFGFGVLPIIGAASGAALGSAPFVEPLGIAVSSGAAAFGAGLGALTGWGLGSVFAGDQASRKLPAENAYSAVVLTSTALVAGVGAAAGAAIAAPFFPTQDVE